MDTLRAAAPPPGPAMAQLEKRPSSELDYTSQDGSMDGMDGSIRVTLAGQDRLREKPVAAGLPSMRGQAAVLEWVRTGGQRSGQVAARGAGADVIQASASEDKLTNRGNKAGQPGWRR